MALEHTDDPMFEKVRANPDDLELRLVFADSLLERGSPRGELIRVQCRLSHEELTEAEEAELKARERELLIAHAPEWLADLEAVVGDVAIRDSSPLEMVDLAAPPKTTCGFFRGFVETIASNCTTMAQIPSEVLCAEIVRRVEVQPNGAQDLFAARDALRSPLVLERAQTLVLGFATEALCQGPLPVTQVFQIDARYGIPPDAYEFVARANAPELTGLSVWGQHMTDASLQTLCKSWGHDSVSRLDLSWNDLTSVGIQYVAECERLMSSLGHLHLGRNSLTNEGCRQLAAARAPKLHTLWMFGTGLVGNEGVEHLMRAKWFLQLIELDLSYNELHDEGVQPLLRSPRDQFFHLCLSETELSAGMRSRLHDRFGELVAT